MVAEWTKGRMLKRSHQRTCRDKPGYTRRFRTFCAIRSCKDELSQVLHKGEVETPRTPFPIAFSTLRNRAYEYREHPFEGGLTSASIPFAQACSPLVVKPLLVTLSPISARPVQARHSTSGVSVLSSRHVLSALSDKKSDSG